MDKAIIEVDTGNLKSGKEKVKTLKQSLVDVSKIVKGLDKSKTIIEMELDDDKFITALERNRERVDVLGGAKCAVMLSLQDGTEKTVNKMTARLERFSSKSYQVRASIDLGGTLNRISLVENKLKEFTGKNWLVTVMTNEVMNNSISQASSQSSYSPPVESIGNIFDGWKRSFKENPMETAFMATMNVAEILGNFKILGDKLKTPRDWIGGKVKGWKSKDPRLPDRFDDIPTREGLPNKVKTRIGNLGKEIKNTGTSTWQKLTRFSNGAGNAAGKKVLTGGLAGKLGTAATAGGKTGLAVGATGATLLSAAGATGAVMTGMGVIDGTKHLIKGFKADNEYDQKYEKTRGAMTLGSTATGAAIGTAILPGIGTFIGGGVGFLLDKLVGKKAAEKVAGGSEGAAEYASKSENAAVKVADESIPIIEKFEEKLNAIQNPEEQKEEISGFVDKMNETTEALTTLAQKNLEEGKEVPEKVLNYLNTMDMYQQMLTQGNPVSGYGNQPIGGYFDPNVPQTYSQYPGVLPGTNEGKGTEGLTAPLQLILSGEKEVKDKIEVSAKDFLVKDNVQATVRVDIGVIPQVTTYVTGGSKKGRRPKHRFRGGIIGGNYPGFAEGGYVQGGAQLITVAEEGTPEAIIPLGKHRRKRAMELFNQVGGYLQAPGFSPKGFAAGGIVGGSIGSGFGGGAGSGSALIDTCNVEINIEAKDGQTLIETIRDHREEISEEVAGVFNAAFKGQFANTPAAGAI